MAQTAFEKLAGIKKPRKKKGDPISALTSVIGKTPSTFHPEAAEGFERKPVGIFKLLDVLNRGQYAVVNPLRRLTDETRDYTAGEYLKSVWHGLTGKERSYTSDVLANLGWQPEDIGGKIARGAVGLAGDILLDPVTYLGLGPLTKVGKMAKAGAALKLGDTLLDLRKLEDLGKATGELSKLMKGAGVADDIIKATTEGYKGVKAANIAEEMAKKFAEYGGKAEAVKLGRNLFKQYKMGQRALLGAEIPRIIPGIGGASARIPIIGDKAEGKLFNLLSKAERKLGAARLAANPEALKALSQPAPKMLKLLKEGKAFVIGKEIYSTNKEGIKLALKNLYKNKAIDEVQKKALRAALKGERDVNKIVSTISKISGVKPKTTFHQFDPVKAAGSWTPVGKTINTLSEAFNFIPTAVKSMRRAAGGSSSRAGNFVTEQIKSLLGKNNETLKSGAREFTDRLGRKFTANDDIIARLEAIEGLHHTVVQDALNAIRKSRPATIDEVIGSLDLLRPENFIKSDYYKTAFEKAAAANRATPVKGLGNETIDRMQDALRRWNNLESINKVEDAVKLHQDFAVKAGLAKPSDILQREAQEGFGYLPHFLEETVKGIKDPRFAHHGQTIFEAVHGLRSDTSVDNLVENWDRIFKKADDGTFVYGKDLLWGEPSNKIRQAITERQSKLENILKEFGGAGGSPSRIRDIKGNVIKNPTLADVKDALNVQKFKSPTSPLIASQRPLRELIRGTSFDIESVADYAKKLKELQKEATAGYEKVAFSPDLVRNLILKVQTAQGRLQSKLVLTNALKFGKKIDPLTGVVPPGYVKLSKVIPPEYYEFLKGIEGSGLLRKEAASTIVPHTYVRPLQELMNISFQKPGAAAQAYDWVLSIFKPFLLSAPATQMRNFVSSFFMGWAGGDFMTRQKLANFKKVAEYCGTLRKHGGEQIFNIRGKDLTLSQIVELFEEAGGKNMDSIINEFLSKGTTQWNKKAARAIKKGTGIVTWPTTKFAEITEDTFRITHFINCLQDGMSVEDAVESVARHFYDYSDLSKFETSVLRRAFPFYTFWRKNLEANLRYLVTNPGYLNVPIKASNEMNRISEGEPGYFPLEWLENERQQWLANQGAFFVPWNRRIATMQGILPQADIANLHPKDLMEQLTGMLTPVLKLPYEVLTNKDTYTGREIETPTKPSVYYVGMNMNPRVQHALRPFRVLDAADYLIKAVWPERAKANGANVRMENDTTPGQKAWNAVHDILGFRSYLQDPESVQLNKRLELVKLIKRTTQYLDSHPKLSPEFRASIIRNKELLEAELARTRSTGETDEELMKTTASSKKSAKYAPLQLMKGL